MVLWFTSSVGGRGSGEMSFDNVKAVAGGLAAVVALATGTLNFSDKLGLELWSRPILEWAPEEFSVAGGPANEGFKVIAARRKFRDDCEVVGFTVEIRDADYIVYPASSSASKFSGAASETVDKFGYFVYLHEMDVAKVAPGRALLLAQIKYECPEGEKIVAYPAHENLSFEIEGPEYDSGR